MFSKPDRSILEGWDIVVIDDDDHSLDIARRILTFYSASIYTAENGKQGLEIVQRVYPKFIISDLSMPVMDGWQFISQIKEDQKLSEIPVIALTAHAMTGDRERAIAAGFHNYLTKPLSPATFITDLLSLLIDIPEIKSRLKGV